MQLEPHRDTEALTEAIINWIREDRVRESLPDIELSADTRLLEHGVFDSLKILEFVHWLEKTYHVKIGVAEMTGRFFASPGQLAINVGKLPLNDGEARP